MSEIAHEVLEEIRRIARHEVEFDGPVERKSALQSDLQLDSMSMVVVAVGLENRFRVRLHEEDAKAVVTVGDLVDLVCRRVGEQVSSRRAT